MAETFLYSVRSSFTNAEVRADFIAWLKGGHLADVVRAGALDAEMVELEAADGAPGEVETRYHFASREAFDAYANGPAVPLRAEGAARFPPSRGIVMQRGFARSLLRLARETA